VAPDDVFEDLARIVSGVDCCDDGVDRPGADGLTPFHELDELVDDRAGLADLAVVTFEREAVPAQP
jgi:hypothetical protein